MYEVCSKEEHEGNKTYKCSQTVTGLVQVLIRHPSMQPAEMIQEHIPPH